MAWHLVKTGMTKKYHNGVSINIDPTSFYLLTFLNESLLFGVQHIIIVTKPVQDFRAGLVKNILARSWEIRSTKKEEEV